MSHFSPERGFAVPVAQAGRSWFPTGALVLGIVLAAQAAWILVPELMRPAMPFFPTSASVAGALATRHAEASLAAAIGWPRGDLWTDKAMTGEAALLSAFENGQASRAQAANGATAETAAKFAPADGRAWLLLAMASARAHNGQAAAQLKMSYYTAPFNAKLFPLRIEVAAQLPAMPDKELQGFLRDDLKTTLHTAPGMTSAVASAYRAATPPARQFFETALAQVDPKLLARLRSANR